jgi:zinc transporter ZupT
MQTQIEGVGERVGSLAAAGTAVGSVIAFIRDPNDVLALLLGAALGAMIGVLLGLLTHSPARY